MLEKYSLSPNQLLMLMFAERPTHSQQILQWQKDGKVVITDRYYLSSYAYNVVGMGGDSGLYDALLYHSKITRPDYWVILTGEAVSVRTEFDKIESYGVTLQNSVNNYFSKMKLEENMIRIDTTGKTIEQVHQEILERIG